MGFDIEMRVRNVTAVLGPTNTGKTHLAIERMLGHDTGMIGLPLRLLAREVYDKIAARTGPGKVALITGEEKIRPENPRYWVSTVEAMPHEIDVDFLAIDEIQLAADPERGHVFTDRLLHARGRLETLLLGAGTMREAIADLVRGAHFISRPRLSKLTYSGQKKITRLPARSAVVAFSANDVYQIAELIRRQRGGAAVVLGALSPRTRNAQVALYQSGDVDFLVATDAIGMGLNLEVDHVAFAGTRKFDGQNHRQLTPAELAQVAGRAGRHMNDGTFGVTGDVLPFEQDVVERLETHIFDTVKTLQWRSRTFDFSSVNALRESLRQLPREPRLVRARMADDLTALENVSLDREVVAMAAGPAAVATLWEVCQIPDYRNISAQNHAEFAATLYKFLLGPGEQIPEDWFARQVAFADRTDGDIDTLANRIAHIRTWTFVSNRPGWLKDPGHWQERTRAIEDSLSDALHERLTLRFVDRRTSALMKRMRDKEEFTADIAQDGAIHVETHYVGRLKGFCFSPDGQADGIHGKAARNAAAQVLAKELSMRARRVASAKNDALKLTRQGRVLWRDEEIARLEPGEQGLSPQLVIIADEHLQAGDKEKVQERLNAWLAELIRERLKPLVEIATAADLSGLARGIAFRMTECFGALKRETVAQEMKSLDQAARAQLRKYGVRFGAFNIYFPLLLKPAAAELTLALWALKHADAHGLALDRLPEPPRPGLTSFAADPELPESFYRAFGFHVCGPRAVRIDILERLADLIRPLLAWRPDAEGSLAAPKGSTGDGGFTPTPEMMSILGCSCEELSHVLRALGFRLERRPRHHAGAAAPLPASTQQAAEAAQGDADVPASPNADNRGAVQPEVSEDPVQPAEPPADSAAAASASLEAPSESPGSNSAADLTIGGSDKPATEPEFEEIWRPRRRREHGRTEERRGKARRYMGTMAGDPAQNGEQPQDRPEPDAGKNRQPRRGRRANDRSGKMQHRRNEPRPVTARQGSSGPQKRTGVDPDSPFAALSALKLALEKRAQDPSSS
jgi:ATP-dependent RNA helicase SUPV3L1/SUV3